MFPKDSIYDSMTGHWYGWIYKNYYDNYGRLRVKQYWGIVR